MARFKYVGSLPPRPDGTYQFRVPAARFSVTFLPNEIFEVPDDQSFVIKCIKGHIEWNLQTGQKMQDYIEVLN